jgi:ribosomal-protein-alanine N-acetyltransferase
VSGQRTTSSGHATLRLQTERLVLRPYLPADLETVVERLVLDPDVIRFWHVYTDPSLPVEARREMGRREFGEWFGSALEAGLPVWILEAADPDLGSAGGFVGVAGVLPPEPELGAEPEVGYMLASAFHGRGLATEAVRALVEDALERPGITGLAAIVDAPNVASIRVLEKAGFRLEREYTGGDGHPYRRYLIDAPG